MNTAKMLQVRPEFLPLSIVRALWKGKLLAGSIWLLATGAAAVVAWRLPSVYYSDALIVVDSPKIPERLVSSLVSNDFNDRLTRITQQIQSSTRLKQIMEEVKLYPEKRKTRVPEDLVEGMRNDIKLKIEGGAGRRANAFRIGFEGSSPAVVAQVANRLANLYIEENLKVRESQAEGATEFVEAQLQESKKKLDELEAAISRYKQEHNGELPQQEAALAGRMARLQMDLRVSADALQRAHDAKQMIESAIPAAESSLATLSRPAAPTAEPEQAGQSAAPAVISAAPARRKRPSDDIENEIRALSARYTADHPEMRRLKQKLAAARALEAEDSPQVAAAPPAAPASPAAPRRTATPATTAESPEVFKAKERLASLQAQLKRTEKEIEERDQEVARLQRDSTDLERRLHQLPIREQEIARITRDYQITRGNYESLMGKKLSAEMSTDLERRQKGERFAILEPARVPGAPSSPNRPAIAMMGSGVGFAIGILLAMALELKRGVLLGEWELGRDYPVLGRLPRIELASAPESGRG